MIDALREILALTEALSSREYCDCGCPEAKSAVMVKPAHSWAVANEASILLRAVIAAEESKSPITQELCPDAQAFRHLVANRLNLEFGYCADDAPTVACGHSEDREDWIHRANFPDPYETTRAAIKQAVIDNGF